MNDDNDETSDDELIKLVLLHCLVTLRTIEQSQIR